MYGEFSRIYEEKIAEDFSHSEASAFILDFLDKYKIPREDLLDTGCGSGRLIEQLLNSFRTITAVDSSEEMLTIAAEKFTGIKRPRFLKSDSVNFKSTGKFDVITAVLDVPNYFKNKNEVDKFIKNSYLNLKEEGLLIFDISTPFKLGQVMGNTTFTVDEEDYFHIWDNRICSENGEKYTDITINIFVSQNKINLNGKLPLYRRITEEQRMLHIDPNFISESVIKAGFLMEIKTDYSIDEDATTYNIKEKKADKAERLIFILRKVNNG